MIEGLFMSPFHHTATRTRWISSKRQGSINLSLGLWSNLMGLAPLNKQGRHGYAFTYHPIRSWCRSLIIVSTVAFLTFIEGSSSFGHMVNYSLLQHYKYVYQIFWVRFYFIVASFFQSLLWQYNLVIGSIRGIWKDK